MKLLYYNETFKNDTQNNIICVTEYYNCFGQKQKNQTVLAPGMSIFSSNPLNRVYIKN